MQRGLPEHEYEPLRLKLLSVGRRMVPQDLNLHGHSLEDFVQDTLMVVSERYESIHTGTLVGYAIKIMFHKIVQYSKLKQATMPLLDHDQDCLKADTETASTQLRSEEESARVASAIECQSESKQAVLKKKFYEGKSQKQIAKEIGKSESEVSKKKALALDDVRQRLSDY